MFYRDGYKYQLSERETFKTKVRPDRDVSTRFLQLFKDGTLIVEAGYAWDGASGPTYDSKNSMRGSLYHDSIYQLLRNGLLKPEWRTVADEELGRILEEDGMWWPRRAMWVNALKLFGGPAARNIKPVLEAP